ncbi:MAG: cohesin domain-containing protein, partial [Gammaproteobacteria bacterium]
MKFTGLRFLLVLGLLNAGTDVMASTISLSPASQNAAIGDTVAFDLNMDFTGDPTIGGGIDIQFDSARLQYVGFTFDSGLGSDPAFTFAPTETSAGKLTSLSFGNFSGLTGPAKIGTFNFKAIASGDALLSLSENAGGSAGNAGGFFNTAGGEQNPTFSGAGVTVAAAPVPLPAGLPLLSGALMGL